MLVIQTDGSPRPDRRWKMNLDQPTVSAYVRVSNPRNAILGFRLDVRARSAARCSVTLLYSPAMSLKFQMPIQASKFTYFEFGALTDLMGAMRANGQELI